jgi:hypothetical protein
MHATCPACHIVLDFVTCPNRAMCKQMWRTCMRFWVLRAVNINFAVLWGMAPCSLVNSVQHLRERAVSIYHTYLQYCTTSSTKDVNAMKVLCVITPVCCYIMLLRCTYFLQDCSQIPSLHVIP